MANEQSIELLIRVTRRLFFSVAPLFVAMLVILALMPKSPNIVPAIVILSGCVGGFVGLQRRLKELTEFDLRLIANSVFYTGLSPLIGGVLALLLYVLFLSGLLSGQLFPHFEVDALIPVDPGSFAVIFYQHAAGYQEYAKLFFWSFVAGYSERFVTDVISRFEGSAVKSILVNGQKDTVVT